MFIIILIIICLYYLDSIFLLLFLFLSHFIKKQLIYLRISKITVSLIISKITVLLIIIVVLKQITRSIYPISTSI